MDRATTMLHLKRDTIYIWDTTIFLKMCVAILLTAICLSRFWHVHQLPFDNYLQFIIDSARITDISKNTLHARQRCLHCFDLLLYYWCLAQFCYGYVIRCLGGARLVHYHERCNTICKIRMLTGGNSLLICKLAHFHIISYQGMQIFLCSPLLIFVLMQLTQFG